MTQGRRAAAAWSLYLGLISSAVLAVVGACTSSNDSPGGSGNPDGGGAGSSDGGADAAYTVTTCPNAGGLLATPCAACVEAECAAEIGAVNTGCAGFLECACPLGVDAASCTPSGACISAFANAGEQCTACNAKCGLGSDAGGTDAAVDSGSDASSADASSGDASSADASADADTNADAQSD
jgi:hypothetical protein